MLSESDTQRVLDVVAQEVEAAGTGDVERYFAILADDAVFMAPNQPPRSGEELRDWLREFLEGFRVEWLRFEHVDAEIDRDLAYHTYAYRWRVTPRAGGEPTVSQGKGLHVLRRQKDGGWKVIREIWNASPGSGGRC
jgi:uncharacterized protein (TIGR02246 family)